MAQLNSKISSSLILYTHSLAPSESFSNDDDDPENTAC